MFKGMNLEIKKSNLYETIAEKLEKLILDDMLKIGDKLPSEQVLAVNFGVSRNVIREALKILKERGLIDVRSGEGAYIVKPKSKILGDMVNRIVIMGDIDFKDVYELRFALEVTACGLAAERMLDDDIEELENIVEEMRNNIQKVDDWVDLDLKFHTKIAKSTKNPLFYSFIKPLAGALCSIIEKGYNSPGACEEGIKGHMLITGAIRKRDRILAENAMLEHLKRSESDVLKYRENRIDT